MILYKYFSNERTNFFENQYVRFTQPSEFNDPFECCPTYVNYDHPDYIEQRMADFVFPIFLDYKKQHPEITFQEFKVKYEKLYNEDREMMLQASREALELTQENVPKQLDRKYGLFCLSENWDNILMWSHYSNEHKGFVVGFESEHPFFSHHDEDNGEITIQEIEYSTKRAELDLIEKYRGDSKDKEILFRKSPHWMYEKEWRKIKNLENADSTISQSKVYLFKTPSDSVKEIVFGMRSSENTNKEVFEKLKLNSTLNHVRVFQAQRDNSRFGIIRKQIDR